LKKIQLKVHKVPVEVAGKKDTVEISEPFLVFQASRFKEERQGQQAYSYEDFKKYTRIDAAFKKMEENNLLLELEDGDFDDIYEKLKKMEWANASKEFVAIVVGLVEKFNKAKEEKEQIRKS